MATKMFYGAGSLIFEWAKDLRNRMTEAEMLLWGYLKQKPLGYKFRRQHPLGFYIADFYCHKLLLVIEVDGKIHEREDVAQNDKERQNVIEGLGLKVIRVTNDDVNKQLEKVVSIIEEFINNHRSL
ncbi:MAG: endonuclease domain-containing protein [Taibaiella sp.]|jgi:cyclase